MTPERRRWAIDWPCREFRLGYAALSNAGTPWSTWDPRVSSAGVGIPAKSRCTSALSDLTKLPQAALQVLEDAIVATLQTAIAVGSHVEATPLPLDHLLAISLLPRERPDVPVPSRSAPVSLSR